MADGVAPADVRSSLATDPLIGRVINDRFKVVGVVARGGMGKVYRAEQAPLGREVALKVLNPSYSGENDPEFHKRFFLEASTCSKLSHPNTVTIFDYGRTDDDVYYIAMELLEGRTLHRALREDGPMSAERTMHVARQVCRSLREAHLLGVIHRDLKPANIFLLQHGDERDYVKVLDFGLVKDLDGAGEDLTQTGLFMGSPKYMSPEQIKGEDVDPRADIYALGVILYEALTGTVPFDRPNSVNILMAHVHDPAPPLRETNPAVDVPAGLSDAVMKALAKNPDDRFESMDALLAELKHLATDSGLAISRSTELHMGIDHGASGRTGQHAPVRLDLPPPAPRPVSSSSEPTEAFSGSQSVPAGSLPSGVTELPSTSQPNAGVHDSLAYSGAHVHSGAHTHSGAIVGGLPPSDAHIVAPEEPRSRAPMLVAAFGGLALLAAVGVALAVSGGQEATRPSQPTAVTPNSNPTQPTPTPPPETVPAVVRTMVSLRSEPPGATVTVGDVEHGPTPSDVEWVGEDARRGRRVSFVFSLEGHQDYTVNRVVTGEQLEVSAQLEPEARAPRPGRRQRGRRGGRGGRGGSAGPVNGYKLDPY